MEKLVYPLWKKNVGFPPEVKTMYDFMLYEAQGFADAHEGPEVIPRKFLKTEEGHVIVEAPAPGYSCRLFEGVYMGIMDMLGIEGKVEQVKCVKNGDETCVFDIQW